MLGKSKKLMLFLLTVSLILGFAAPVFAVDETRGERILGGQVYAQPHRSTPEEFEHRKELYRELISLRNANRQRDSITLNMSSYRAIMETIWGGAKEVYRGLIRPIPICGELIPAEYQEPESKKEEYYKQQTELHNNFCDYAARYHKYEQLICVYFILSQEIEELQKPLLDLSPETIYTMKNLEGRMEYLRQRLPELTQTGHDILAAETTKISTINEHWRRHVYSLLSDFYHTWPEDDLWVSADMIKRFNAITDAHFRKAMKAYQGEIDYIPLHMEVMMPQEYLNSPKKMEYVKLHERRYQNFCEYLKTIPENERLICEYEQQLTMTKYLEKPILNLSTDNPYPDQNLMQRFLTIKEIVPEIVSMRNKLMKINSSDIINNIGEKKQ